MMAVETSDRDIAPDLNFSQLRSFDDLKIKPYTTSWGRGKIQLENGDMPESKKSTSGFEWFVRKPIGKLPDSLSRGRKLEILKENCSYKGKEVEVREQLKAAQSVGWSNESIEETFKKRLHPVGVIDGGKFGGEQFEDSEPDNTPKGIENNITLNATEKSSSNTTTEPSVNKKSKRRRYRNVALESLERMNNSSDLINHSPEVGLQFMKNSLLIPKPTGQRTVNNIPPACYRPFRKKTDSFEYCDSDFPKL